MTKAEQKEAELLALGKEITERDEAIVTEYKRTHKLPGRGMVHTPERTALREEAKLRYGEILARYAEEE